MVHNTGGIHALLQVDPLFQLSSFAGSPAYLAPPSAPRPSAAAPVSALVDFIVTLAAPAAPFPLFLTRDCSSPVPVAGGSSAVSSLADSPAANIFLAAAFSDLGRCLAICRLLGALLARAAFPAYLLAARVDNPALSEGPLQPTPAVDSAGWVGDKEPSDSAGLSACAARREGKASKAPSSRQMARQRSKSKKAAAKKMLVAGESASDETVGDPLAMGTSDEQSRVAQTGNTMAGAAAVPMKSTRALTGGCSRRRCCRGQRKRGS